MIAQRLGVQGHVDRVEAELREGVAHHGLPGRLVSEERRRLDEFYEQLLHPGPLGGDRAKDLIVGRAHGAIQSQSGRTTGGEPMAKTTTTLRGISEIRAFFRTNQTPIYFVSPTAFNLLGIDRWVRNFFYVTYFDSFEGSHPRVFVPTDRAVPRVRLHRGRLQLPAPAPRRCSTSSRRRGPGGKAAFVMFDEETEALAAEAGLEVAPPSGGAPHRLDSKIVTTRLAEEAGVPSVPNVLGRATSYDELAGARRRRRARRRPGRPDALRRLGQDDLLHPRQRRLGRATPRSIATQELKVMRRINPARSPSRPCITRHGTLVGPLMTTSPAIRS